MGICLAVRHHGTHQSRQLKISPVKCGAPSSSVDLDLVALCLRDIICSTSASPSASPIALVDEMRVKMGKDTSSKVQIGYVGLGLDPPQVSGHAGKRRHETEVIPIIKSNTNINLAMEGKCGNEQTKQTSSLNRKMSTIELCSPPKRMRNETMLISAAELSAFFKLFDDDVIQDFLWMDSCAKVADKFLLAMVFTYFKRAKYTPRQYTRMNFFLALYLASDMEEDEEECKYEIFPWALGKNWRNKYTGFLRKRDKLLRTIDYRAAVSSICCEEVMSLYPDHIIWQREREEHHSGAIRRYDDEVDDSFIPIGPNGSPLHCDLCAKTGSFAYCKPVSLTYGSPVSCEECLYLSSCSDMSTDSMEELEIFEKSGNSPIPGSFDMHGLKSTLQAAPDDSYFWAGRDE